MKIKLLPNLKRNILLISLLTFISFLTFAQKNITDLVLENKLLKPYNRYFDRDHDRELVYTHLNKSSYILGDDIWFTSYVLNPVSRQLNFKTSKLYVELWSPKKEMISRKILFVYAGSANNFIHLPDSLAPGSYCLRAYTNWMRNFVEDSAFNTYITILGPAKAIASEPFLKHPNNSVDLSVQKKKSSVPEIKSDYDIQFLPESGTFLEGIDNVLGVRATDPYGKSMKINGKVFTAENKEIAAFSTDAFGTDNIIIPEVSNQPYRAEVILPDGTIRTLPLPKAESNGVVVRINPYGPDMVWFILQTNEATRKLNKSYIVMIHANGTLFKTLLTGFSKSRVIRLSIRKNELGSGIISATIFDENLAPVAERIFYNHDTNIHQNVTLAAGQLPNDTVNLRIAITDTLTKSRFTKLSISVLPGATLLNHFNNSLMAESILRPVLRGNIENPNAYFEKNDIYHIIAIDNLLLTQGWRKYDWPAILQDTIPKFRYPFEEGFSVEVGVKNWLKNKPELKSKITLISPQNNLFLSAPVDSVGAFKIDHVYLNDSTLVIASALSTKGQNWNRVLQLSVPEFFMDVPDLQQPLMPPVRPKEIMEDIPKLTKGTIQLQEMVVTAQKKNPFANNVYVGLMDQVLELTKDNCNQFPNMEMLLQINFNVSLVRTDNGEHQFNMGRRNMLSDRPANPPVMMIDGWKVVDPQDILNFPIELVEAVAVNKDGFRSGMEGSMGTIAIKSRTTPLIVNKTELTNIKRILVNGYAAPRKYFEPKYNILPGATDYEKYAAIFWKPDLVIDSTKSAAFRFYVPKEISTMSVRVEGISFDGKIFLHEEKITLPGRK